MAEMRKRTKIIAAGALAVMVCTAGPALAKPITTHTEGCTLLLPPDENGVVRDFYDDDALLTIKYDDKNGKSSSKCRGDLPEGVDAPDKSIKLTGFPCATTLPDGNVTTNSKAEIKKNGDIKTDCKYKP